MVTAAYAVALAFFAAGVFFAGRLFLKVRGRSGPLTRRVRLQVVGALLLASLVPVKVFVAPGVSDRALLVVALAIGLAGLVLLYMGREADPR